MNKKKLFLTVQSVLCVLITALLIAAVIGIYLEGAEIREEQPLYWIFTPEKLAQRLAPVLPVLGIGLMMTAAGLILGIRGESRKRPAKGRGGRSAGKEGWPPQNDKTAVPGRAGLLRILCLAMAAGLITAGAINGSAMDVLGKAIKICTECIGLG